MLIVDLVEFEHLEETHIGQHFLGGVGTVIKSHFQLQEFLEVVLLLEEADVDVGTLHTFLELVTYLLIQFLAVAKQPVEVQGEVLPRGSTAHNLQRNEFLAQVVGS